MAKQFDHLFEEIRSFENLWTAWKKAAKGKRGQVEVADFEMDADLRILQIQAQLQHGTWQPGPYRNFEINDPKRRVVSAAPFADRVVHHALVQVIEPLFERTFIGDSYANRVGKGTHAALDKAQGWVREYKYFLPCDLKQFFPSIDHAVLQNILARKIACLPTLALCERILASGVGLLDGEYDMAFFAGDDLLAAQRPRGLPIGNLTSQFWANVLLNELDQFVKRELGCHPYLRYVDDFLLFSDDKRQLWQWKAAVVDKLAQLRLRLHDRRACVGTSESGLPFLGFRLFAQHRRLKSRNAWAFSHRLAVGKRRVAAGLATQDQFVIAQQVQLTAFELQSRLLDARHGLNQTQSLRRSDSCLARLRAQLRLCLDWLLIAPRQFEHVSGRLVEIGRLLGAWIRSVVKSANVVEAA